VIARGSVKALNPTVKGIPTERPEITTSCGLNHTVKGILTERPETTTSCGLNPTIKGISTERPETTISCGQSNVYVLVKQFFVKSMNYFTMIIFCSRGKGIE
jgi:hypothetical protein